jgi:hypothetical protein
MLWVDGSTRGLGKLKTALSDVIYPLPSKKKQRFYSLLSVMLLFSSSLLHK